MRVTFDPIRAANVFMMRPHLEQPYRSDWLPPEKPRRRPAQPSKGGVESSPLLCVDRALGELWTSASEFVETYATCHDHPAEERRDSAKAVK